MKTKTVAWERFLKLERDVKDALKLASSHDPDFVKLFKSIDMRLNVLERQMERLGALKYRRVK